MASILGNYLRAQEGAYFKVEQEASVQAHKQRLIKEGKIPAEDPSNKQNKHPQPSLDDSASLYEVLPEVHAARARIDAPDASRRKQYEVRIKGEPEPATEEELRRYRISSGVAAAVGHIPRLSLAGRNRYAFPNAADLKNGGDSVVHSRTLSPEAAEVAARSYNAGVRSLMYGSLLGLGLVAVSGSVFVQYYEIRSGADFRRALQPLGERVKSMIEPMKRKAEKWAAVSGGESAVDSNSSTSAFQARLKDRYNPSSNNGGGGGARGNSSIVF